MSVAQSAHVQSGQAIATWVDGVEGASVPVDDRGLQYGDGLFETVLVRNAVPRFIDLHRRRLRQGLERLHFPPLDDRALLDDITRAAALAPARAVLKIIVTRGSSARGYVPPSDARPRRIVSLWPDAPTAAGLCEQGVSLGIAKLRLPALSALAGLKHLNRLDHVLAATEREAGMHDVLLLDTNDLLVSGSACNVFLVKTGELMTPRVERAGVAGVMRSVVLREAARLGIAAWETDLTLRDLASADALFITNARIGVVPVKRVREHEFVVSEISTRLHQAIELLDA
jgi:4-amino-4-deoxychorismate lyase